MLLLVAVERSESRLLLAIEADVNETVVAHLPEGDVDFDQTTIAQADKQALWERKVIRFQRCRRERDPHTSPSP